ILRPEGPYVAIQVLDRNGLTEWLYQGFLGAQEPFRFGLVHDQTPAESDHGDQNTERQSCVEVHIEQPQPEAGCSRVGPEPAEADHFVQSFRIRWGRWRPKVDLRILIQSEGGTQIRVVPERCFQALPKFGSSAGATTLPAAMAERASRLISIH